MNAKTRAALLADAGALTRVSGVSTEQTVKTGKCRLARLVIANGNAAVQTLTIKNAATTLIVLRIPAGDSRQFDLNLPIGTSLKVTPSHADIDALFSVVS